MEVFMQYLNYWLVLNDNILAVTTRHWKWPNIYQGIMQQLRVQKFNWQWCRNKFYDKLLTKNPRMVSTVVFTRSQPEHQSTALMCFSSYHILTEINCIHFLFIHLLFSVAKFTFQWRVLLLDFNVMCKTQILMWKISFTNWFLKQQIV